MTHPTVVEVKDLVKELGSGAGRVTAVKGVDLNIRAGELTLLMGPSGSGKTTLLSMLGCILSPTSGSIRVAGESIEGMTAEQLADLRRRHIGFIFQSYNLFPTLTALENVRIALDVRGESRGESRRRAEEALKEVGLGHRLNSFPRTMSGGEQQRVAVARALAGQPKLILADEPTAALDSENGQSVMALIAELAKDPNRAVLAVTHDPRILPYADRVIRIEDGRIVSESNRDEIQGRAEVTEMKDRKRRRKLHA